MISIDNPPIIRSSRRKPICARRSQRCHPVLQRSCPTACSVSRCSMLAAMRALLVAERDALLVARPARSNSHSMHFAHAPLRARKAHEENHRCVRHATIITLPHLPAPTKRLAPLMVSRTAVIDRSKRGHAAAKPDVSPTASARARWLPATVPLHSSAAVSSPIR
jgi:hypothetical protein